MHWHLRITIASFACYVEERSPGRQKDDVSLTTVQRGKEKTACLVDTSSRVPEVFDLDRALLVMIFDGSLIGLSMVSE